MYNTSHYYVCTYLHYIQNIEFLDKKKKNITPFTYNINVKNKNIHFKINKFSSVGVIINNILMRHFNNYLITKNKYVTYSIMIIICIL